MTPILIEFIWNCNNYAVMLRVVGALELDHSFDRWPFWNSIAIERMVLDLIPWETEYVLINPPMSLPSSHWSIYSPMTPRLLRGRPELSITYVYLQKFRPVNWSLGIAYPACRNKPLKGTEMCRLVICKFQNVTATEKLTPDKWTDLTATTFG